MSLAPTPTRTSTTLLTPALVVAAFHHSFGSPFGSPVIAPIFVRGLRNDRIDCGWPAVLIERDVGHVTRIRVTLLSPQNVLGEHLDPDLHRRPAREVDPGHGGHHLADVNRLADIPFFEPEGRTLPA